MMAMIRKFFGGGHPRFDASEDPDKKAWRELTGRLIEEHRSANVKGRAQIEERSKVGSSYLSALGEAMEILGDR